VLCGDCHSKCGHSREEEQKYLHWTYRYLRALKYAPNEQDQAFLDQHKDKNYRTPKQNRSLHKLCGQIAQELNDRGIPLQAVMPPTVDIYANTANVKECVWRPIQKAETGKQSSTKLETDEPDKILDILNREIFAPKGMYFDWPSQESERIKKLGY